MFATPPAFDLLLLNWINQKLRLALFDFLMPLFSNSLLLWLCALLILLLLRGDKARLTVLCLAMGLAAGVSDLSCSVFKEYSARLRPLHSIAGTFYLEGSDWAQLPADFSPEKRKGTSFPSAHAANSAAVTMVLFLIYRKKSFWLVPLLVGYSRVYLGKHFPLDVVTGWFLGVIIGYGVFRLGQVCLPKFSWSASRDFSG